ncbi:acyltransferase [Bacillus sp. KH172YL63]|uniref:acyltransferase n=1 Tax=Bacillus sp. KH172YL63 TaxID=2709784 RepID=UPI0013E4BBB4|nr:acyltransferase [Bacillus sp. KH172YL63]BCB05861.1 acyltransferase [Bacillus sp. KH172YL63]
MYNRNNNLWELNFIRSIAILAVLAIHVYGSLLVDQNTSGTTFYFSMFINQISRFSVPAFLFVSGILAFWTFEKYTFKKIILKRIREWMIPYVTWTVLGLLMVSEFSLKKIGIALFTGTGPFFQLYYIPLLIQFYLLTPFLIKIARKKLYVISIIILNILGLIVFEYYLKQPIGITKTFNRISLVLQSGYFLWIVYYLTGIVVGGSYVNFKSIISKYSLKMVILGYCFSLIILFIDCYFGWWNLPNRTALLGFFRPEIAIYTFFSLLLLFKISSFFQFEVLRKIYMQSFGIYLAHLAIIILLKEISDIFFSNFLFTSLSFVLSLLISYSFTVVIRRTPFAFLFIGQK